MVKFPKLVGEQCLGEACQIPSKSKHVTHFTSASVRAWAEALSKKLGVMRDFDDGEVIGYRASIGEINEIARELLRVAKAKDA